nr:hypothetical protein [Tanacetum cinerariifolium]
MSPRTPIYKIYHPPSPCTAAGSRHHQGSSHPARHHHQLHPAATSTYNTTTATTPPSVHDTADTTTTATAAAFLAVVVGCGWRIGHHRRGAARRQTTIVVAVGRSYSHHSRTMWCRAVAEQPLRVPHCAQPFDAIAMAATEPAVATTATTAAPWWCWACGAITITLYLPTLETKDYLRMGDEHLDTIPATKSNEFIKSSVENLVPSPSESDDLSDNECDEPACNDFTTFSNLLFDANDDFYSSDNKSFSNEDISKKIYSNPLFDEEIISIKIDQHHFNVESDLIESLLNQDSSIISSSSKIDSLLDEFARELTLLKSILSGIDKNDCDPKEEIRLIKKLLYDNSSPHPPEEFISENSDAAIKSFSLFPIYIEDSDSFMEEINLSFTSNDPMPPGIEEDDYDSERDMLIFEELLSNDSLLTPKNESFHFDIPSFSRPPAKPPDDNLRILTVKVVDDISELYVPIPRLLPTQPTLVSNQEKSPHLLSHRGFKAY